MKRKLQKTPDNNLEKDIHEQLKTKIYSSDFKKKYEDAFYIQKNKINLFFVLALNFEYFLC